ncbi:MAG TPA: lysozyme, partial [Phenylobacterium sp.]|nr:lysozyme [Phenylobacterium sp.]
MTKLTLDLVRQVDATVRGLATYVPDDPKKDSWRSHAKAVMAGKPFKDDCDGWAQTALHVLALKGAPRDQLFRAMVSSKGTDLVDHMIGLVRIGGAFWTVGDTFGPPVQVKGDRAGPHRILEVDDLIARGGRTDWGPWDSAAKVGRRETNPASTGMRASEACRAFIKGHEKCVLIPYDDFRPRHTLRPGDTILGALTAGYGHTGADVVLGRKITLAQAEKWFEQDIARFERAVRRLLKVDVTQGQFDALVSFAY